MRYGSGRRGVAAAATVLAGVAGAAAFGGAARADVTFGGNARTVAMGGAGLALVDQADRGSAALNPAALALRRPGFGVSLPTLGLRASGIPIGDVFDRLSGGKIDENDATELARDFGKRDAVFSLNAEFGLRFGPGEALGNGIARARLLPDETFRTWARSGADVSALPASARADLIGAAVYTLPAVAAGFNFTRPGSPSSVYAGLRIKPMRAVYSHYVVTGTNVINDTDALRAPEMNGKDTLRRSGLGIDLGVLVRPHDRPDGLSAALVATNLIKPSLVFHGTDRNGAPFRYDLQPTSVSAGTAFRTGNALVAFDLVDIGSAYGDVEARLGGEIRAGRFALRAGYASGGGGLTYGVGIGSFDLAFGAHTPVAVTRSLNF